MEGMNLDAVFGDEEVQPESVEEAPQEQPEEAQTDSRPRDEKGRFAPKGEEEDGSTPEPVEEEQPEPEKGLKAGITAERKKRQEWEARYGDLESRYNSEIENLRKELEQLRQPKEPDQPPPTIWEDEEGWQQHFGQRVSSQAAMNARLDTSEMLARDKFDDFDQMKEKFIGMMQENPALQQQALSDPHPWRKAYQIAKNAETMKELGAVDLSDLEAKIEARLREKLEAEKPQQPEQPIPSSLADAQSGRGSNPQTGPLTLEQILGVKK